MENTNKKLFELLVKYRWIMIPLVPTLFFVLMIILIIIPAGTEQAFRENPTLSQFPTPIPVEVNSNKNDIPDSHIEPVDQNQIKGFQRKEVSTGGETKYFSASSNPERSDLTIAGPDGFPIFERITTPPDSPLLLSKFSNLYGQAKWIFNSSVFYGSSARTYIYPDRGLALIANPITDQVLEQHIFQPMRVEEYLRKYGDDIPAIPEP